jgi:uncharacterized protein YlbG (UPF0298 family)
MNFTKSIPLLIISGCALCHGYFWSRNDSRVMEQTIPDPNTMNQNLVVNLNYSPTQIKASLLPSHLGSNIPFKEWQDKTSSFLFNKRYFLGTTAVLGGYIYTCAYIVKANKYLEKADNWINWRSDIPFDILITTPQNELAKELILEIQRRYSNAQNPTDFISPLILFIQTIDAEMDTIKNYTDVYWLITKMHVQMLLPINQKQFSTLHEKYKKLLYLKNIFLSWAAEYKVSHNKNKRYMPAYKLA